MKFKLFKVNELLGCRLTCCRDDKKKGAPGIVLRNAGQNEEGGGGNSFIQKVYSDQGCQVEKIKRAKIGHKQFQKGQIPPPPPKKS